MEESSDVRRREDIAASEEMRDGRKRVEMVIYELMEKASGEPESGYVIRRDEGSEMIKRSFRAVEAEEVRGVEKRAPDFESGSIE